MSHQCSCCGGPDVVRIATPAPRFSADQTVEEAGRAPGALAVLQRLCVNHCCGAHMTLAEAAAAAGLSVDTLLRALGETTTAPA
jgi:iron-sulfur cluster repair protein YtfE (RIC family)